MYKSVLKFFVGGLGLIVLGMIALYAFRYMRMRNSPEYRAEQQIKEVRKQYAEDSYGGNTPEETLQLFISALKKGDTELAAKYFVLDKQNQWREDLAKMKDRNLLEVMIKDLESAQRGNDLNENSARFVISNEQKEVTAMVSISKSANGKWKIIDF